MRLASACASMTMHASTLTLDSQEARLVAGHKDLQVVGKGPRNLGHSHGALLVNVDDRASFEQLAIFSLFEQQRDFLP